MSLRADIKTVARGWRWSRRPLVPRSVEPLALEPRDFPTAWARTESAKAARAFLQRYALKPLIELETKPLRLLVRFESIEAAATEQARQATRIAESNGAGTTIVAGADETALWEAHERRAWEDDGAVIKLTLLPKDLSATLAWLASTGEAWEMIGRAGVGALLLRVDGDAAAQARVLKDLRARFAPGRGSAVLVRGSEALKALVDVWGPPGDSLPLMRAVKQQFDPEGLLNPGRGPFGL